VICSVCVAELAGHVGRQEEALQQLRWAMHAYPNLGPQLIRVLKMRQDKDATLPYIPLIHTAEAEMARGTTSSGVTSGH
jgi:hypothetical protein